MAVEASRMVLGLLDVDDLVIDGQLTVSTLGKTLLKQSVMRMTVVCILVTYHEVMLAQEP